MPSYRVTDDTLLLSIFDVVGTDDKRVPGFITHAALAAMPGPYENGRVPVVDMGPPLRGFAVSQHQRVSVVGSADLTDDEQWKLKMFVHLHASEHHDAFSDLAPEQMIPNYPRMYCIVPHVVEDSEPEPDKRFQVVRFSCAGFVYEAYKRAGIELLDIAALPQVGMDVIRSAYRGPMHLMRREKINPADLGLEGDGPWPVLLCGYLFHALNRDAQTIRESPYVPTADDQCFA